MSLATLQLRTIAVPYLGANDVLTDIVLYGLNANDVAGLILQQKDNMKEIFDIVEGSGIKRASDLAEADMLDVAKNLMVSMPDFIARIIAWASHEPDQWTVAMQLDAPTQLRCLRAVAELTFRDEANFREFLGNVRAVLQSAKRVVPQANQQLD